MKQYMIAAVCLVLTAALLTGCGCTNSKKDDSTSAPTVLPTNEEVWDTTQSSTQATTQSTTESTASSSETTLPTETADHGNGPLEDTTSTTESSQGSGAQRMIPGGK